MLGIFGMGQSISGRQCHAGPIPRFRGSFARGSNALGSAAVMASRIRLIGGNGGSGIRRWDINPNMAAPVSGGLNLGFTASSAAGMSGSSTRPMGINLTMAAPVSSADNLGINVGVAAGMVGGQWMDGFRLATGPPPRNPEVAQ